MQAVISLLRGVNLGGHHKIRMDALRTIYESIGLLGARTYLQSGNVVFFTARRVTPALARRIEESIESAFGFHSDVVLRTTADMEAVVRNNPFAGREIDPAKLAVSFLRGNPSPDAWRELERMRTDPEELKHTARELYMYFPNGMGRTKLPFAAIDRTLKTTGTARNWNTVTNLLAIAEEMHTALRSGDR